MYMHRIISFATLFCFSFSISAQNADSTWFVNNYTKKEVYIPMRDGIKLFTSFYIPKDKTVVSFQSRLGNDKWMEPYTDETLGKLPLKNVKNLAIVCPAFVSDCLETLEEISVEGKEQFLHAGGENFHYIPCLNDEDRWI